VADTATERVPFIAGWMAAWAFGGTRTCSRQPTLCTLVCT
jgi:hypothetical protein